MKRVNSSLLYYKEEKTMKFERAFKLMQSGAKIKLPSWGGYWYWDDEKKTVIMHTK